MNHLLVKETPKLAETKNLIPKNVTQTFPRIWIGHRGPRGCSHRTDILSGQNQRSSIWVLGVLAGCSWGCLLVKGASIYDSKVDENVWSIRNCWQIVFSGPIHFSCKEDDLKHHQPSKHIHHGFLGSSTLTRRSWTSWPEWWTMPSECCQKSSYNKGWKSSSTSSPARSTSITDSLALQL